MSNYIGRFAPTPSGPLHLGSLVAALGSFLSARASGGRWHLRIDDLDSSRIVPGAESTIYRQLESHALYWDGVPYRQSEHRAEYDQAIERLAVRGLTYACECTRAQLRTAPRSSSGEPVYPGTCRSRHLDGKRQAIRVKVPNISSVFDDSVLGPLKCELAAEVGDFVIRRRDGVIAYQLACAVDEVSMGITHVVRGADLTTSTFRQIFLMDLLDGRRPAYAHLPLAMDPSGRKLSKQNHADALAEPRATANLIWALDHLGQRHPAEARHWTPGELVDFAVQHWSPNASI